MRLAQENLKAKEEEKVRVEKTKQASLMLAKFNAIVVKMTAIGDSPAYANLPGVISGPFTAMLVMFTEYVCVATAVIQTRGVGDLPVVDNKVSMQLLLLT